MATNDPHAKVLSLFAGFLKEFGNSSVEVGKPYANDNRALQVNISIEDPNGKHTGIQGVQALRRLLHQDEGKGRHLRRHAAGMIADLTGRGFEEVAPEYFDELAEHLGEVSKVLADAGHET